MEALDLPAGDDRTLADQAVACFAAAAGWPFFGKNEFGRRQVGLVGTHGPIAIVHVQLRIDRDQVQVGFVVGIEGAHVAPIGLGFSIFVHEGIGEGAEVMDDRRDDVAAEIMVAGMARGVEAELFE